MHDHQCTTCGAEAGDTTNDGVIVSGGFGSTRHDTTSLIWLVRGQNVPAPGILCDDCVDRHIAAGELEAFASALCRIPANPSEAAMRELFAYGARQAYHRCWEHIDASHHPIRPLDEAGREAIIDLRRMLTGDDTAAPQSFSCTTSGQGDLALRVGRAHATAAIALGYGEADPGFDIAAARWARQRTEQNERIKDIEKQIMDDLLGLGTGD